MRFVWPEKWKFRTLFARLLASFLAIIVLLAAFNFGSFLYLKSKIHDEIVKYNGLNMKHTAESYENHFKLTLDMMLSLNQNSDLSANLNVLRQLSEQAGYDKTVKVHTEINTLLANPLLYYENILFYFKNGDYVLEKEGTSEAKDTFGKFYVSPDYKPEFWRQQFDGSYVYRILPASQFSQSYMNSGKSLGHLIPVVLKNSMHRDLLFIVMLDSNRMARTLHYSLENPLLIVDDQGQLIFSSDSRAAAGQLPSFTGDSSSLTQNGYYYFQEKGKFTGFRYVTMVPIQSISSELLRLNLILITLLAVTIAISLMTSIWLSVRLNTPVQRLIQAVGQYQSLDGPPNPSGIREFQLIGEQIRRMHQDLSDKSSLLRSYAFTDKLKQIRTNHDELKDVAFHRPFVVILFRLEFFSGFLDMPHMNRERVTYFIREYIQTHFSQIHEDNLTFQIDKDQILSLIFHEEAPDEWLLPLKAVFDNDKDWCLFTMAVSSSYREASDFVLAYEEALKLAEGRMPYAETQLIRVAAQRPLYRLTAMQQEELQTKIRAGNAESLREWIREQLENLQSSEQTTSDLQRFVRHAAELAMKEAESAGVKTEELPGEAELLTQTGQCHTYEQARLLLEHVLLLCAQTMMAKNENKDPVIEFVKDYLDQHLSEDVSLDLMADKLNLSRGYLSTYFKDKTGMNFSDYLHRVRIRKAQSLLLDLELKIHEIALELGYQNVNSFIRMFKRYAGVTPGEYRKQQSGHS
ncbi:Helix-turn-helix domain-containing protein [Paenibacillus sp. UNCCL117]|uniref:helix-turn-helix domain-containing protein n=1 Tax=unclassified Paenibacillus TaxID=185978 RepID=UPI0008926131|nr:MULTISPECIES: helix-turn-helix domain-containing protein [unclassified Paenibacillus]SDD79747.1 Helix-turn-helix domain-containing protein [Paenibacillus sp. cl123]SFW53271.1 Helix-turn-helix domain-containing protein [Paenibacillus sp. UNCCL117]